MFRTRVPLLSVLLVVGFLGGFAIAGRGAGGTYSLPAGNPVVSGTTITSTWANTTLSDMATGITDSLDRQGRGGMLAPLQCQSGSALAPGLTFSAEPTSGLYRQAAGDIRFSVTGTRVFSWATSGNASSVPLSITGRTTTTNLTVTGTSEALTITPTTANATGLYSTGSYGGAGVYAGGGVDGGTGVIAVGGGTSGIGVSATGSGAGAGIVAAGGATAGNGITASATAGNGNGGEFTGQGSGKGVEATGGATSGTGGQFSGGAPNGYGVRAFGSGSSPGVYAYGGTTGAGLQALNGTAATGGARTNAIIVSNGDINMDGVAQPSSTTAVKNVITPVSFAKAWGHLRLDATGASISVSNGLNISGVALATSNWNAANAHGTDRIDVTFAQAMSSANYAITVTVGKGAGLGGPACGPYVSSKSSTGFSLYLYSLNVSGSAAGGCAQTINTGWPVVWGGLDIDFAVHAMQ